jgi:uncharacterized protein
MGNRFYLFTPFFFIPKPVKLPNMEIHTFRLRPGQDLLDEITAYVSQQRIQAGCILSGVGSLTHTVLRLANQDSYAQFEGHFEIVAITGTTAVSGSHLHIAISDENGKTTGGHLVSGCKVYTTAEIILGVIPGQVFRREPCPDSGYDELVVDLLP